MNLIRLYKIRKTVWIYLIVVLLLIFFILYFSYYIQDNSWVAKVNGQPIIKNEFQQELVDSRAGIYNYFSNKYGIVDNKDFWHSSYSGEIPIVTCRKKTLDRCINIKIQQMIAKQEGIIDNISYTVFLKNLEEENKRRQSAVRNNRVIYGPMKYGEKEYFDYFFSNMVIELKQKLWDKEWKIDDNELEEFYKTQERRYTSGSSVKVYKIQIMFIDKTGEKNNRLKLDAKDKIEQIKEILDKGEDFDRLSALHNNGLINKQIFNDATYRGDCLSEENTLLREEAMKLLEGEVSDIIKTNNSFCIMKSIEKKASDYIPFSEIQNIVKSDYIERKYNELINRLLSEAIIEINENVYKKMEVR